MQLKTNVLSQNSVRDGTITLIGERSSVELPSTTLLVALDDTGHDQFAPGHSVFGLGGCACLVSDYGRLIDDPWRSMKSEYFEGPDVPLKASSYSGRLNKGQIDAMEEFFSRCQFFRLVTLAPKSMTNETEYSLLSITCRLLLDQIAAIAALTQPTDVAIVMENSQRIEKILIASLSGYPLGNDKDETTIEPKLFLLPKNANTSLLEVSDWIANFAHKQLRDQPTEKLNRIFSAMFSNNLSYRNVEMSVRTPQHQPKPV